MMKALIIEDNPKESALFAEQARLFGYDVTCCQTARESLDALKTSVYPFIILDLGLPDKDGLELCRRIRALPQSYQTMIVVLTGRDTPEDLQAALDAGADDYFIKPISMEYFRIRLTIIERQLQHLTRRNQAEKALHQSFSRIEQAKQEWESTVDSLSEVICVLERGGRVLYANKAIERWNLGTVTGVQGRNIHALLHPDCGDAACYLREFLTKAWKEVARGRAAESHVQDDILQRFLSIQVRPITNQDKRYAQKTGSFAVIILKDITDRKRTEKRLRTQDELLRGVAKATNCLLVMPDINAAIPKALKTLGLATNVDRVMIVKIETDPRTGAPSGRQMFEWTLDVSDAEAAEPRYTEEYFRSWYEALISNKFVYGLVRKLPPAKHALFAPRHVLSFLLIPITINDQFWGILELDDCHSERKWREEERTILSAMAGSIGGAMTQEEAEHKLRRTSSDLRALFQALPDEYFRLGADGSILDYNLAHEKNLSSDTFIGKWASGLLPDDVDTQFEQAMAQVRHTKTLTHLEYKLPETGDQPRYEEIRVLPFLDDQLIVVVRDITDRKLAEEELRKHRDHLEELVEARTSELTAANASLQEEIMKRRLTESALRELNQQLEEASRQKSHFVANMSHELRTPLNATLGYLSLTLSALKDTLKPTQLNNLVKAEQSARTLRELINDVLDFSKIEAGRTELHIEPVTLSDILDEVLLIAEGLLLGKPVELKAEIAPDLPDIESDFTKVKQILNNLIGNAIKFTHEGQVAVRAMPIGARTSCPHQESGQDVRAPMGVRIEVEDTGEGIPEEKIDTIFESFKQVDSSITKRYGGTGLGLAISQKFCELLGITIDVRSQVGQGTCFRLEIPVQFPEENRQPQEHHPAAVSVSLPEDPVETNDSLPSTSILVIEDDELSRKLIGKIFSTAGYTVYDAGSGAEGVALAVKYLPDIVLTDLVMQEINGFEVAAQLQQHPTTQHIPIFACSAVATEEFKAKAFETGCVGYITKPIEPDQLVEQITAHVKVS